MIARDVCAPPPIAGPNPFSQVRRTRYRTVSVYPQFQMGPMGV